MLTEQIPTQRNKKARAVTRKASDKNAHSATKRILDYLLGVPAFLLALPIMTITGLLIKMISPGPALFVQEREGLHGRRIRVFKFRSMYVDADERLRQHFEEHPEREAEWTQFFKLDKDPRVLPWIGHFMRKSSLDELPNLWNVLRGDMSLVGPRPFPYYHLEEFTPEFREMRSSVWPGITGLWQVERGDTDTQEVLDRTYVEKWSLKLDLIILLRTIPVVLLAKKPHY